MTESVISNNIEHTAIKIILSAEAQSLLKKLLKSPKAELQAFFALRLLRKIWPDIFSILHPKPLKIGIHKDIAKISIIPEYVIDSALKFFTMQDRYLATIKLAQNRFDLNNKPVGKIQLREVVDAEIKRFEQDTEIQKKDRFIIKKIKILSINAKKVE